MLHWAENRLDGVFGKHKPAQARHLWVDTQTFLEVIVRSKAFLASWMARCARLRSITATMSP